MRRAERQNRVVDPHLLRDDVLGQESEACPFEVGHGRHRAERGGMGPEEIETLIPDEGAVNGLRQMRTDYPEAPENRRSSIGATAPSIGIASYGDWVKGERA